jgi:sugar lactone lactonase YvrE
MAGMTTRTRPAERPRGRAAALAAAAAVLAAGCTVFGSAPPPPPVAKLGKAKAAAVAVGYTGGSLDSRRKYWPGAADAYQRAFAFNPTDDGAAYLAAAARAREGDAPGTLEWLDQLWRLNSCLVPLPRTFAAAASDPRFRDILAMLKAQAPKTHRSTVAFTLAARDLLPGDLAWDAAGKVFYVASLRKRRIYRVTRGAPGAPAAAAEFAGAGLEPLDAVLGVKVDAKRGRLWAVTAADPAMEGATPEDAGRSRLVAFDLATGASLGRWSPVGRPPHQFGGLAVGGDGNVWVTDTLTGEVFVLRKGADELAVVAPAGTFIAPKAIAVSPDGARIWVADLARGVYRLDPATGEASLLDQPPGPWPAGVDGLVFHRNALVGVAGTVSLGRVVRWTLEPDGNSFSSIEVLDCAHPSYRVPVGGTVAGDDYVYVANSQIDALDADGALPPAEKLDDLVFMSLPLGR